jgi:hypothetical protein
MTIKEEIIGLCKEYVRLHKRVPNRLHISVLRAYDLLQLQFEAIGQEAMDTLISDGPHAFLEDWGFLGLKVAWLNDLTDMGIAVSMAEERKERRDEDQQGRQQRRK